MLIVLPSTPTTEKASEFLKAKGFEHQLIPIPETLGYKTGSDLAIYTESPERNTMLSELTKERFVVMRVFKDYHLPG
jgi:hypothetical protein